MFQQVYVRYFNKGNELCIITGMQYVDIKTALHHVLDGGWLYTVNRLYPVSEKRAFYIAKGGYEASATFTEEELIAELVQVEAA
jgi:hypothetical protein